MPLISNNQSHNHNTTHPQQRSLEPSHPTSNLHQVSSNSTHSSDISPTDSGISLRPNRVKSYSISNGVLSHSRTANKRVSFSNLHSTNSSQLSLTSSESSENEIYSDEDDEKKIMRLEKIMIIPKI